MSAFTTNDFQVPHPIEAEEAGLGDTVQNVKIIGDGR